MRSTKDKISSKRENWEILVQNKKGALVYYMKMFLKFYFLERKHFMLHVRLLVGLKFFLMSTKGTLITVLGFKPC